LTDKAGFDDDRGFDNLSKRDGLELHRLSYHCQQALCPECDGVIRYSFMKEVEGFTEEGGYFDMQKNEYIPKPQKMFHWDPEFNQTQLKGDIQSKSNTPEGSKCECFCHGARKHKPRPVASMQIHKYAQKELAPEVAKELE
jgi:hypothetical protein